MIEVINYKYIMCQKCKSMLRFADTDIEKKVTVNDMIFKYIMCPECGNTIPIELNGESFYRYSAKEAEEYEKEVHKTKYAIE